MSTPLVDHLIAVTPAGTLLRQVSDRMTELAGAATPGAWTHMCMGSEGCRVVNDGNARDRERVAFFGGKKDWRADHADAGYVTGAQPAVMRATGRLLAELAEHADRGSQGALVQDGLAVCRAFMDATGWRP